MYIFNCFKKKQTWKELYDQDPYSKIEQEQERERKEQELKKKKYEQYYIQNPEKLYNDIEILENCSKKIFSKSKKNESDEI